MRQCSPCSHAVLLHTYMLIDLQSALLAQVRPVHSGTATLKDATSEAIRDWVTNVETTHYILGSAAGPHPYPMMVRDFQAVIGEETRRQCQAAFGGKPDILLACVGGGSNAIGLFHEVRSLCPQPGCLCYSVWQVAILQLSLRLK